MTLRHLFTWVLVLLLFVGAVSILQPIFGLTAAILVVATIVVLAKLLK